MRASARACFSLSLCLSSSSLRFSVSLIHTTHVLDVDLARPVPHALHQAQGLPQLANRPEGRQVGFVFVPARPPGRAPQGVGQRARRPWSAADDGGQRVFQ